MAENIKNIKKALREEARGLRSSMTPDYREKASAKIFDKIKQMDCYRQSRSILIYVTFGDEIVTPPFIRYMIEDGKNVYTPTCLKDSAMALCRTANFPDDHRPGTWGILEMDPETAETIEPEGLDMVITPGLAFTLTGKRLGYGGGYYDRLFSATRDDCVKLVPTYDCCIVDDIPYGRYDRYVDILVTEKKTVFVKK